MPAPGIVEKRSRTVPSPRCRARWLNTLTAATQYIVISSEISDPCGASGRISTRWGSHVSLPVSISRLLAENCRLWWKTLRNRHFGKLQRPPATWPGELQRPPAIWRCEQSMTISTQDGFRARTDTWLQITVCCAIWTWLSSVQLHSRSTSARVCRFAS